MKKKIIFPMLFLAGLCFLFSSCEKEGAFKTYKKGQKGNHLSLMHLVSQESCGEVLTTDLLAGKSTKVGVVEVTTDGTYLTVKYQITVPGWLISETHLSVTPSLEDVPTGDGNNPKIGLFMYNDTHDPYVHEYTYGNIPVNGQSQLLILAHAVVVQELGWETNLEELELMLPETAEMSVTYPGTGSMSYFNTTITNGGMLDGTYPGWCIDVDNVIYQNTTYLVEVFSSYDPDLASLGLVEFPENMNKVNWILNQNYVGQLAPDGTTYTFGDVQRAIWALIEDENSTSGLGPWSQDRVDVILAEAEAYGGMFVPACGDFVAILLRPINPDGSVASIQITLILYPLECIPVYGDETAWGAGEDFGGSSWAMYFPYCVK